MAELTVEILAGIFTLILFLIIAFYLFPRMKQEYQTRGWSWKHYYQVCGDNGVKLRVSTTSQQTGGILTLKTDSMHVYPLCFDENIMVIRNYLLKQNSISFVTFIPFLSMCEYLN